MLYDVSLFSLPPRLKHDPLISYQWQLVGNGIRYRILRPLTRTWLTYSTRKPISPIPTYKTTYLNIRERMVETISIKTWG
jgi:hypothetical protein